MTEVNTDGKQRKSTKKFKDSEKEKMFPIIEREVSLGRGNKGIALALHHLGHTMPDGSRITAGWVYSTLASTFYKDWVAAVNQGRKITQDPETFVQQEMVMARAPEGVKQTEATVPPPAKPVSRGIGEDGLEDLLKSIENIAADKKYSPTRRIVFIRSLLT